MGSSYFGGPNPGNERSSRKGKKSNNAEYNKPKQPQRGLGVAQLEKIRLHTQLASTYQEDERMQTSYSSVVPSSLPYTSSSSYGFHVPQNLMVGLAQLEGTTTTTTRYGDSRPSFTTPRWQPTSNGILDTQQFAQPSIARHFLNPQAEDSGQNRRNNGGSDSIYASSQNTQTCDTQELDLELRL